MTQIAPPEHIRHYWMSKLAPKDWYVANDAVDADITQRFLPTWEAARDGKCNDWLMSADGVLSFLILCDQFPQNGWDLKVPEPARQFIYMPLMHSETLADQDLAIEMFAQRMPETGMSNHEHCIAHRYVIATFGRFPYRNAALGRTTTPAEQAFLDAGGYGHALRLVQAGQK